MTTTSYIYLERSGDGNVWMQKKTDRIDVIAVILTIDILIWEMHVWFLTSSCNSHICFGTILPRTDDGISRLFRNMLDSE